MGLFIVIVVLLQNTYFSVTSRLFYFLSTVMVVFVSLYCYLTIVMVVLVGSYCCYLPVVTEVFTVNGLGSVGSKGMAGARYRR